MCSLCRWFAILGLLIFCDATFARDSDGKAGAPAGWTTAAPREEIRPEFAFEPAGGMAGTGCLVIKTDGREGLDGCWQKTFPVVGGKHFRFAAYYQANRRPVSVAESTNEH